MNLVELTNTKLTQEEFNFVKSKLESCECILIGSHRDICSFCHGWRKRYGIDPYMSAKAWMKYDSSHISIL